jgi:phasin family protein
MQKDMFSQAFENVNALPAPLVKANKLVVAEVEKLVNFQMGAARYYTEMMLNQMKAAAEVNDMKSLQAFLQGQTEVANVMRQRVMEDVKALTEMGNGIKADFDELAKDSVVELTPRAKAA